MLAAGDCGRHGGAQWEKRDRDNRAHTKVPLTRAGEVHNAGEPENATATSTAKMTKAKKLRVDAFQRVPVH